MYINGSYIYFSSITFLQKQSYVEAHLLNKQGEGMLYLKMGLGQETTDLLPPLRSCLYLYSPKPITPGNV